MAPPKRAAPDPRRSFVTPEGVDLQLRLASASARAGAFMIDAALILATLILFTLLIAFILDGARAQVGAIFEILWLVVSFVLRNGWFVLFEMGGRGATPGKRALGLRVVARDGARLTGGAVIARNAMREIELFLPLSFAVGQSFDSNGDAGFAIAALLWSGIFLFFPLFNRDRLRVGDLLAGTWVVEAERRALATDLAVQQPARRFSESALALYGEYELQTLEEVLRAGRRDAITVVAATIRAKAALPDDGDDEGFLRDYYAALCARLEAGLLVGQRRADKFG